MCVDVLSTELQLHPKLTVYGILSQSRVRCITPLNVYYAGGAKCVQSSSTNISSMLTKGKGRTSYNILLSNKRCIECMQSVVESKPIASSSFWIVLSGSLLVEHPFLLHSFVST